MTPRPRMCRSPLLVLSFFAISGGIATAGLDDYLKKPDDSFAWKALEARTLPQGTVHPFEFTSQTWQGIVWKHALTVVEPKVNTFPDAMLLFITGGGNPPSEIRDRDLEVAFGLAKLCGARVAVLPQVPNQPLLGDKREDTLIAETFVRYLETKDREWPLLFPMVKSAVKAMDAVQAWAKAEGKPIERFVVTGASKRGWTTWLTGASDPRVKAIAPMVIPTLNFRAQNEHQLEAFEGKYSEQIDDYTRRGLMEKIKSAEGEVLWKMVDPLTYRDRLTLPKLQINGTNDPYWTLNSMNIYWDDLKGPKTVVYLPNAHHGLEVHREYALTGVGALFRQVIGGRPAPVLGWKHSNGKDRLNLVMESKPAPKSAKLWVATAPARDFRQSKWESTDLTPSSRIETGVDVPKSGRIALFADLEYEVDGFSHHLSTQIHEGAAAAASASK